MKKSLIALAALAATSAFAQSSVSLYGVTDIWFGAQKNSVRINGATTTDRTSNMLGDGGVSSSRIGFKGTEDLGGGLKANFVLEQGFNLTNGAQADAGTAFSREASLGVSGGFGAVKAGKVYTPYHDVRSANNDTFDANVAAVNNTWVDYLANPQSGIKYTSPNFSGFSGSVGYHLGGDKTATTSASSILSLGGQYVNGPVSVGVAHQVQKQSGTAFGQDNALPAFIASSAELSSSYQTAVGLKGVNNGKVKYTLINGSYNFGVVKVLAGYDVAKQEKVGGEFKATEFDLGAEVPLASNLNLGVGYARSSLKENGKTFGKATGYSAALVYSLSKRTAVYGALSQARYKDEDGSGDQIKSTLYAVGMKHAF